MATRQTANVGHFVVDPSHERFHFFTKSTHLQISIISKKTDRSTGPQKVSLKGWSEPTDRTCLQHVASFGMCRAVAHRKISLGPFLAIYTASPLELPQNKKHLAD